MAINKPTLGGPRPGAGRKKSAPTKIITFRVKTTDASKLRVAINKLIKSYPFTPP